MALGVVPGHVQAQMAREPLVPQQLIVLLVVVVGLTVIIMYVAVIVVIFSAGVIGAAVEALLVLRRVVPGMIGLLDTVPGQQFHNRVV